MHYSKEYQEQFWLRFRGYLKRNQPLLIPFDEICNYVEFRKGSGILGTYSGIQFLNLGQDHNKAPVWLTGWICPEVSRAAAKLCFREPTLFCQLKNNKDTIQKSFNETLDWEQRPARSVGFYHDNIDFKNIKIEDDLTGFAELFYWLRKSLEALNKVFSEKLARYCIEGFD